MAEPYRGDALQANQSIIIKLEKSQLAGFDNDLPPAFFLAPIGAEGIPREVRAAHRFF